VRDTKTDIARPAKPARATVSKSWNKQVADQLGKEAEVDPSNGNSIKSVFRTTKIDAVRRGVKGADIIHDIMVDAKRMGRIVYESKETSRIGATVLFRKRNVTRRNMTHPTLSS